MMTNCRLSTAGIGELDQQGLTNALGYSTTEQRSGAEFV
jgi:hypothetical protein